MTISLASPIEIQKHLLEPGMTVLRPAWVQDPESGRRYDPRQDAPGLPDVLLVKAWDWEEGESRLMSLDGRVGIDYNVVDYPDEFVLVGDHTGDPVFRDAQDVGDDLKIQDPDDCRIYAWDPPWLRQGLTDEQEQEALWVQLTLCRPGWESSPSTWLYQVELMRGEDSVEDVAPDDWPEA
ncbi:MAG: hypothetical protein Q8Q14_07295, partial [Gemmatimonadales bacterium]|nr:hypothetical protein [Gemmatimonadales bacterium]